MPPIGQTDAKADDRTDARTDAGTDAETDDTAVRAFARAHGPGVATVTRAALYARVSTTRQDLDLQLEELRRFAQGRGWEIVGEYTDIISGASTKREGLDRLRADAHRQRFDVVAVWKLDRLGRSLIHMIQVIDEFLSRGVELASVTEPHMDSTTPQGRLLRNIFASVAEYERELTANACGPVCAGPMNAGCSSAGPGAQWTWQRSGSGAPRARAGARSPERFGSLPLPFGVVPNSLSGILRHAPPPV